VESRYGRVDGTGTGAFLSSRSSSEIVVTIS
jgi:hypothetical protein